MANGFYKIPTPKNEPVLSYAPGTNERKSLQKALKECLSKEEDLPMYIGSDRVRTGNKVPINPPHDHQHILGYYHMGDGSHIEQAINAALGAKERWANLSWEHRASIFLKAADLISSKYRYILNAATMLCQSKDPHQSEMMQ